MKTSHLIAIIEKDDSLRNTLKEILIFHAFEVLTFRCAEDFLAQDNFGQIDLILSDFNMAGMDGFQLLRLLKKQNNNTPVILMSGSLLIQKENVFELSAAAFMPKPFRLTDLLGQIQLCISGSRHISSVRLKIE
jgi:DNA-binding response OmpR family regulator